MRLVNAVRYNGPMLTSAGQRTASQPHVLSCDDGQEYVFKPLRNCDVNRTLVNESVAGEIAEILGVRVPGLAHIQISADLVARSSELVSLGTVAGMYLGCRLLPLAFDLYKMNPGPDLANMIENPEDAIGIIVVDIYAWNTDRNNPGNLLVEPVAAHRYRLYAIDHGHCFSGPNWTDAGLAALPPQAYTIPTHPLLQACMARGGDGEGLVLGTEQLPDADVAAIVDRIPQDWNFADSSRAAIKSYMRDRKMYSRRDSKARGVPCR
jgi:hypothetical protein